MSAVGEVGCLASACARPAPVPAADAGCFDMVRAQWMCSVYMPEGPLLTRLPPLLGAALSVRLRSRLYCEASPVLPRRPGRQNVTRGRPASSLRQRQSRESGAV